MPIVTSVEVQETALWQQGDVRDPLGVWGCRLQVTGDATTGSVLVTFRVPEARRSAYVYTCYSTQIVLLSSAVVAVTAKCRLLTNWPNVDPQPGVQGYDTVQVMNLNGTSLFANEISGPFENFFLTSNDRFIPLFDPRAGVTGDLDIVELELGKNLIAEVYSFAGYGYFWDRSVMAAPGGLRHPGSN